MDRNDKQQFATELKEKFSNAKLAIFADYKGLTSNQANQLRKLLRQQNAEVKVIKNNVARKVFGDGAFGEDAKSVVDSVVGPTLIALGYGDIAQTAKTMHKFATDVEAFNLKDSLMGNKKLHVGDIGELANLPSREVLLAKTLGTLNAPITNFVGVLAAVPRSLVTVLAAIEKKKTEQQG